jgi:gliding motility-associated-like protein
VLCYGDATGSFQVDATGGTTGYTYQLGNGAFGNSNVFNGLTAGSYVVTVKDANGCTTTVNVTITQPNAPLSASSSNQVNVLCYGDATGSFQVDATGGTTGYTYQLGNGAFGNSNVFNGLVAGTYVVTVKDNNGCTTTVTVTITQPNAPLSASIDSQTNVLCFGNATGSVTIAASGGTVGNGYQYQLGNGPLQLSPTFNGLIAGSYVVTVSDANGCIDTVNVTITQPNGGLTASSSNQVNILCYGDATGSFQVDALGGTPGYTYQLGNGAFGNSNVFSGLTAGTYVVTVKDASGCTTTVTVTITQPNAPLSASSSDQVNVLCYGNATGSFQIDATGGTAAYQYQLDNGAFVNSNVFSGLVAGTYVVTVKDANGCTTTVSVTITQPNAPLSASSSNQVDVLCYGNATGSFQIDATSGTAAYTYQLDNGAFGNSNVFSGLVAGTYVVTVKDANGCTTTVSVTITQPNAPLSASITNSVDVCFGYAVGSATVSPSGGTTPYTYSWNTVPAQSGATATGLAAGSYIVTVTDSNGCTTTASVTINSNAIPNAGGDQNICEETADLVDAAQDQSWSALAGNPANATVNPVTGAISGMTSGGVYLFALTSTFGCSDTVAVTTTSNCPIIANPDYVTTPEDSSVTIDVPNNDTDPDGNIDNGSVTIIDPPNNGTVIVNPDGTIIYTPNPNYNGTDSLIYQICDTGMPVYCDTALVVIVVTPVNDPPVANQDTATTPEDTPIVIDVPDNDTDVDGNIDNGSVTIIDPPNNGTVIINPDGTIIYTPDTNYNGVDTLIYQICDTGMPVLCDTALVIINVTPVNDPPVAITDTASTVEDTPININIDINDFDVDGNLDTNTVVIVIPPVNGSASYDPNLGEIIYIPNPDFFGTDSLLYQICDSLGLCDTAWVYIVIESVPDITLDPSIFPSGNNISCFGANDGSIDLTIDLGTPPYIISWTGPNGFTSSSEDISGLAPGTYTVIVTDLNGNIAQGSITLTEPTLLQGSGVVFSYNGGYNVSCGGQSPACDGSIDYTVSGGSPAYSYSWTGPNGFTAATQDISGLCAGTYTIVVTDVNGCTVTNTYTLTAPPALDPTVVYANYNGYNVTCNGSCDGSINLTVNGGVAPFSYAWVGPNNFSSTSEDINNLCAGNYSVVVTDANGCTATVNVTLTQPPVLAASLLAATYNGGVNVSCANACDGSINATITGGVAPFAYAWTGPNGFTSSSEDISALCAGTYVLTVTDANGCSTSQTITLTQPAPVTVGLAAAQFNGGYNVSCVGSCNGSINATIGGGTAPYSYSWIGPNGFVAVTEDISTLCVGTYTLTVTDANGCTATQTITLIPPPALEVGGAAFEFNGGYNISCANACDGSIDLVVSGGVAPFVISWTGPNNFSSSSEDIANLCAGTYTVTVTDANGCISSQTITITQPPAISVSLQAALYNGEVNVSCANACDGSINATIGGGTTPYSYSWIGPNGFVAVTQDLSNLCAGTYVLTITDANGCTASQTITLQAPDTLEASAVAAITDGGTNISCNGVCDGSIDLTVTGGSQPYAISWTGPNGFVSTDEDISSLCVGTYVATIIDANGCTTSVTITLSQPPPVSSSGIVSTYAGGFNVGCNGGSNGSIDLTVTGGSGSYTYNWSGPNNFSANTQDVSDLVAGTYTVIISDVNGCSDTLSFNLTEPEVITTSATSSPSSCGQPNGSINLSVAGGSGVFSYSWTGPNSFTANTQDLTGIVGGEYIVEVIDTNGCSVFDTINVTLKPLVTATGTISNSTCNTSCNGAIDLTVATGEDPFSFAWSGPNNFSASSEDISSLCQGDYIVIVTDADGCSFADTFNIAAPEPVALTVTGLNAATCTASNGSVTIVPAGGHGGYSFSWTGPNGYTSTEQNPTDLATGSYTVTVTDSVGCSHDQVIAIGSVSNLVLAATSVNATCHGLNNGTACADATGATAPISYLWSTGDTTQCVDSLAPGTYIVAITDANGCAGSDTIVITEPELLAIAGDVLVYPNGYNVSVINGSDGAIDISVTGGSGVYTYVWTIVNDSTAEDQLNLVADTYVVVVTDANGCTVTAEYILEQPPIIELPTGFSPGNFDGMNDYYVIHGIDGLIDNKFTVFNRWGQVIYEKEGYQNDWAGTNQNGNMMPDGTYFILFTVKVPGQGELTFKATVEQRQNLGK